MKKLTFVIIAASQVLLLTGSYAANTTLTWGALENSIGDASNNPLPTGDIVLAGTFQGLTPSQVAADAAAVSAGTFSGGAAAFENDFTTFATTTMAGANVGNTPGFFSAVSSNSASTLGIVGDEIYYFVFNNSTQSAATQYGIFTAPANSMWAFPNDTTIPQAIITDVGDVPQNSSGILWGSFNNTASQYDLAQIQAIPEPSTFALGGMGALGLLIAARRKRK